MSSLTNKKLAQVIIMLAETEGISTLVETGTFQGRTTSWASKNFAQVITVEIDPETRRKTMGNLASATNIQFLEGCSREVLPSAIEALGTNKTCFWLDAHKGGGHFGDGDDCPILEEIECTNLMGDAAYVFIDDARGFLKPPPPPFDWKYWPSLSTIIDALNSGPDPRYVIVVDDVIVSVPAAASNELRKSIWDQYPDL